MEPKKEECALKLAEESGGYVATKDLKQAGLNVYDIKVLLEEGKLERIKRGFYRCTETQVTIQHRDFFDKICKKTGLVGVSLIKYYQGGENDVPATRDHAKRNRFDKPASFRKPDLGAYEAVYRVMQDLGLVP